MSSIQVTIMVPGLNEAENIETTVQTVKRAIELEKVAAEIIVVDDGSTDTTGDIAERLSGENPGLVSVIHNSTNMGLGASFSRVLPLARGKKFTWFPGDNDIPLDLMRSMLRHSGDADMVLTYLINQEIRGRVRFLISTVYTLLYNSIFGLYLQYFNGPGVYDTEMLRKLTVRSQRFSLSAEIHIKMLRMGASFVEIAGYMQKGSDGSSAISTRNFSEVVRMFFVLLHEIFFTDRDRYNHHPCRVIRLGDPQKAAPTSGTTHNRSVSAPEDGLALTDR